MAAQKQGAAGFVKALGEGAIDILDSGSGSESERDARLRQLLEAGFGLERMSRDVAGPGWTEANAGQRQAFREAFEAYLVDHLVTLLKDETPEEIEIRRSRALGDGQTRVTTGVKRFGVALAELDWLVREEAGAFQVIDVKQDGVSLMASYRSEFSAFLQSREMDDLTATLRQKVASR